MEITMPDIMPLLTKDQWIARLSTWAVERWGQDRAQAIRAEIDALADQLLVVAEYPLTMEQMPDFFME
jgi:hypothetical protein